MKRLAELLAAVSQQSIEVKITSNVPINKYPIEQETHLRLSINLPEVSLETDLIWLISGRDIHRHGSPSGSESLSLSYPGSPTVNYAGHPFLPTRFQNLLDPLARRALLASAPTPPR